MSPQTVNFFELVMIIAALCAYCGMTAVVCWLVLRSGIGGLGKCFLCTLALLCVPSMHYQNPNNAKQEQGAEQQTASLESGLKQLKSPKHENVAAE